MPSSLPPRIRHLAHLRRDRGHEQPRAAAAEAVLLTQELAVDDLARPQAEAQEAYAAYEAVRRP